MPNTYLKPEKYVALALAKLEKKAILPMAFTKVDGTVFKGARDDQVTVFKTPGITRARDYEWRTRTAPIVLDRISRTETTLTMKDHIYNAIPITDEELSLDITSFDQEVLDPQLTAVAERAEGKVWNALKSNNGFKRTDLEVNAANRVLEELLKIKSVLDAQGTPKANRRLIVGADMANWIRMSDDLVRYDPSQATTTFRQATLGRVADFDIIEFHGIEDNSFYAVHQTALVFANMAPASPEGATYSARQSYNGWALRVLKDYDPNFLRDRSIVSMFGGTAPVLDELDMEKDDLGIWVPKLDTEGEPVYTGKNVRGAAGTFVPVAAPAG